MAKVENWTLEEMREPTLTVLARREREDAFPAYTKRPQSKRIQQISSRSLTRSHSRNAPLPRTSQRPLPPLPLPNSHLLLDDPPQSPPRIAPKLAHKALERHFPHARVERGEGVGEVAGEGGEGGCA